MRLPRLSIILATHNRRDVLAHTLEQIARLELRPPEVETIIVDNASTEDVATVARSFPGTELLALRRNYGPCAKALGVDRARAPVLLFLDDDSYPRPDCLPRLLDRFDQQPDLGALGGTVHLRDGSQECCALPHVFVGCGVGLRASAVRAVGNIDLSFFMAAEEYDLSFRLLQAGWEVEISADFAVEHLKTPQARRPERTTYYDVVNNLRLIGRYLPDPQATTYRADWLQRYRWLAESHGHGRAWRRGRWVGAWRSFWERPRYHRWRLGKRAFEQVFCWDRVEQQCVTLYALGARRVLFADLGKNVYAFWRGAHRAGLEIVAIADDAYAVADGSAAPRAYRGVPIVTRAAGLATSYDAIVLSNTSFVHAARRTAELTALGARPVHNWFAPPCPTPAAPCALSAVLVSATPPVVCRSS